MPYPRGLPDYHVHTFRCGHAGGDSRDFVRKALERGLCEMAFTDHIPLYFLPESERDPRLAMREDQFDGYAAEVEALRQEFRGQIPVRPSASYTLSRGFSRSSSRRGFR